MSSSWWDNKLNNGQPARQTPPTAYPPMPPSYSNPPAYQAPNPYPQQQAVGRTPESARSYERCPNCSSGNYGKHPTAPEAKARCYDCGYPLTQSGSGMPGMSLPTSGNTQAAKQVDVGNNYNPGTIIGRIS